MFCVRHTPRTLFLCYHPSQGVISQRINHVKTWVNAGSVHRITCRDFA